MTETNPVLYILMRTDLSSMNHGKGMAQSSHASNAFVFSQLKRWSSEPMKTGWNKFLMFVGLKKFTNDDFMKWVHSTNQGFGTVLVLAVDNQQMQTAVNIADQFDFICNVVHDPTYPVQIPTELGMQLDGADDGHGAFSVGDGYGYITIPLDTCAYVFGDKNDPILGAILGNFPLHK